MRKTIFFTLILLLTTSAFAQVRTPRVSQGATLTQTIGLTDVTIKYSRPGVKGRTIWGDVVPYDKVWRTGANEATTINFSDDVWINGNKLARGMYSLHTIPGRDEWTVIFNSVADQWGSYSYDETKDALRIKVKPEPSNFEEWLNFEVPELSSDAAKIVIKWEKVAVPFTVETKSVERTMSALKGAMNPDWRASYNAALFAFENKGAATDADMNTWLDQSLKSSQNVQNLYLKARIAARAGNKADAVRLGEQAIAAATPAQKNFADTVRADVERWKR
ncbi:MAG TPA: DUF2911 domain-containing protein [Thermoanaerobaculia bacterium]|nr:DUF2911 domain-containing protein [Thermoanaerobaculia bacterium]